MWELVGRLLTAVFGGIVVFYVSVLFSLMGKGGLETILWAILRSAGLGVAALALILLLSGCALPPESLEPHEVRGLEMLHAFGRSDERCCCD